MKKECELILLSVLQNRTKKEEEKLNSLIKEELDWGFIAGQLLHHRIGGYFLIGLNDEQQKYLFPELRKSLDLLVRVQKKQTLDMINLTLPILEDLDKAEIKYAALKGLVFNSSIYKPGIRRSNDVDLLVFEDDLDKLDKLLRKHGYIQTFLKNDKFKEASRKDKLMQRLNHHDLVPYIKKINSEFLDMHMIDINFQFASKDNDITKEIIKYGTQTYENEFYQIKGLPFETNLAYLCVHFYREATNSIWTSGRRDVVLYKLVDIVNTLKTCDNKDKFSSWAQLVEKLNLEEAVYYTLYQVSQFYDNIAPVEIMEQLKPADLSYLKEITNNSGETIKKREKSFFDAAFDLTFSREV